MCRQKVSRQCLKSGVEVKAPSRALRDGGRGRGSGCANERGVYSSSVVAAIAFRGEALRLCLAREESDQAKVLMCKGMDQWATGTVAGIGRCQPPPSWATMAGRCSPESDGPIRTGRRHEAG